MGEHYIEISIYVLLVWEKFARTENQIYLTYIINIYKYDTLQYKVWPPKNVQ